MKRLDLEGVRVGRLRVLSRASGRYWLAQCDCGNMHRVRNDHVREARVQSCGCWHDEAARRPKKHGQCCKRTRGETSEHRTWVLMRRRCAAPGDKRWADYGGRGIRVCDRWQSFDNFFADMGPKPTPTHSLDRIDVDGNYEPNNCRWATRVEQARNTRKKRILVVNGEADTLASWAERMGVDKRRIHFRLKQGWSDTDAVLVPLGGRS